MNTKIKKYTLSILFLIAVAIVSTSTIVLANETPSDMVSYWKLDEGTGVIASDSAGYNHGIVNGATWTAGQIGNALKFDGNDDYVEAPSGTFNDVFKGSFTFEIWLYDTAPAPDNKTNYSIFYKADSASFTNNSLWFYKTRQRGHYAFFYSDTDGNYDLVPLKAPTQTGAGDSSWHHYVVVFDRVNLTKHAYKDGTEIYSGNSLLLGDITNTGSAIIGNHYNRNAKAGWLGLIDDVAIYNRVLTPEEVQQHYQNGLQGLGYEANDSGSSCDAIIIEMQTEIDSLTAQLEEKDLIIADRDAQILALEADLQQANQTIQTKQAQIGSLTLQVANLNAQIATLDAQVAERNQIIAKRDTEIVVLKAERDALIANLATLQAQIDSLNATLNTLQEALADITGDPGFVIPGDTPAEQIQNLVNAISGLPKGQRQNLANDLIGM